MEAGAVLVESDAGILTIHPMRDNLRLLISRAGFLSNYSTHPGGPKFRCFTYFVIPGWPRMVI